MSPTKLVIVAGICLWIAGGCQQSIAPSLAWHGGQPDFLLIVVSCLTLFLQRRGGTVLGFLAGVITGGAAGANMTAYVITRTVTGHLLGWFNELEFDANVIVALVATLFATLTAQLMLMFGVHRGPVLPFLTGTLISAVINGVLAMPFYVVLKRLLDPPHR